MILLANLKVFGFKKFMSARKIFDETKKKKKD